MNFNLISKDYLERLTQSLSLIPTEPVETLAQSLLRAWKDRRSVFIFGNGGSAGNAIHLANDFLYGISKKLGHGMKVTALPSNSSVITCLANDEGYESIFAGQLATLAEPGDIAIALSGSGNSPNILKALKYCKEKDILTFALLGFDGGEAKNSADHVIHVPISDMQISEDLQLIVGHLIMQWLYSNKDTVS